MNNRKIFALTGAALLIISTILIALLGFPTRKEHSFSFKSTYKEKDVILKASYYEANNAEYAVLICPGYSCDRQKWRPMADLLLTNGCSVMIFDYSGQGASAGTIGFDNAKTDAIPAEIDDALAKLHELSGLPYESIILMGHSMGGRSILRLLYDYNNPSAVTSVTKKNIENIILMSPEVNYQHNAQASLFAGTSDAFEEPWVSYDAGNIENVNVYLFGSTADDIVKDEDILAIASHLGLSGLPSEGKVSKAGTNEYGSKITVDVVGGVLHSYQMYSPKFAKLVNNAVGDITGVIPTFATYKISFVYTSWILGLCGLFFCLYALNKENGETVSLYEQELTINDHGAFLKAKLLMWLPGFLFAFLICCLCVVIPFGSPVMNIPYMCCISGYGLAMLLAYRKGKFRGTSGHLARISFKIKADTKDILVTASALVVLLLFVWFVLYGTMYRLIPMNLRLFWVLFATILMTVGYYISGCEKDALVKSNASSGTMFLYNIIQYVALFILVAFYLIIKSYSGVIGQAQNMVFMYVFCVPLGDFIRKKLNNRFLGALTSAFVFQTFMITSAALIAIL